MFFNDDFWEFFDDFWIKIGFIALVFFSATGVFYWLFHLYNLHK